MRWPYQMAESVGEGSGGVGSGTESTPPPTPTTAPPAASEPSDPGGLLGWKSLLREDARGLSTIQDFKSPSDLAVSYDSLRRTLQDRVEVPKADASPEDWGKYYERIGRPKDASAYTYDPAQHLPEGVTIASDFETSLREFAHDAGLMPQQFEKTVRFVGNFIRESHNLTAAQRATAQAEGQRALEKEFGAATPRMRAQAGKFFESIGQGLFVNDPVKGQELMDQIAASELSTNPVFVAAFSEAYTRMHEGGLLESDITSGVSMMTKDALETQRATLLNDKLMNTRTWTPEKERQLNGIYEQLERINAPRGQRVA